MMKRCTLILLAGLIVIILTGCASTVMTKFVLAAGAKEKYESGDYDGAIAAAEVAVAKDPAYGSGWYWLGVSLEAKSQYDKALEAFNKVIVYQYNASVIQVFDTYWRMTYIYFDKKNDVDKTLEYGNKIINYYDGNKYATKTDSTESKLNEESPTVAAVHCRVGWAHFGKGNYEEAKKSFDNALDHSLSASQLIREWSYRGRGWLYLRQNLYILALNDFNSVLQIVAPSNKFYIQDGLRGRGWANFYSSKFDLALKDFNKALENIGADEKVSLQDAYLGKAFCYLGLKDKETSLAMINKIREIIPSYNPDYHLSLIYYAAGEKEMARKYRGGSSYVGVRVKDYATGPVRGVEITEVIKDTGAKEAGLIPGDVIIRLHNFDIKNSDDFTQKARVLVPGTTIKVKIIREGIEREFPLRVGSADSVMESDPLIAHFVEKKQVEKTQAKPLGAFCGQ